MHLDEDKLEALRRWGGGLQEGRGEESAAAGRAILMLIAEIEQLEIDLRGVREQLSRVGDQSSDDATRSPEEFASTLHERAAMEAERTSASPAWIEALRRHK